MFGKTIPMAIFMARSFTFFGEGARKGEGHADKTHRPLCLWDQLQ